MQSDQLDKLFKALSQAQAEFPTIASNRKAYTNDYADHYTILRQVYPVLKKHGLYVGAWAGKIDGVQMIGARLGHESGQYIINSYDLIIDAVKTPQDKLTHKTAGSLTYFKRYHVKDILGVLLSDDPEDDDQQGPCPTTKQVPVKSVETISQDQLEILNIEVGADEDLIAKVKDFCNVSKLSEIAKDRYLDIIKKIKSYKQALLNGNKS